MHLDAEKRTDMFVQGAQQSEETELFHIITRFFFPLLFAFASSLILSVISVCQSPPHGNKPRRHLLSGVGCTFNCGHSTVGSELSIVEVEQGHSPRQLRYEQLA